MELNKKLLFIQKITKKINDYNYFYNPSFSSKKISTKELKNIRKKYIEENKSSNIKIYIHTPFCEKKCNFCQYHSKEIHNHQEIVDYINYLKDFIEYFSDIFKTKSIYGVYFGGGTSSIYSEEELETLLNIVFSNFSFSEKYLKEYELNPISTTYKKLDILKNYGIERISFGVQSFNKEILDNEGRTYCSEQKIKELVEYARKIGIIDVNIDLIAGLNKESEASIYENINKAINCNPNKITIYTIQLNKENSIFYTNEETFYKKIGKIHKTISEKIINNSGYYIGYQDLHSCITLQKEDNNNNNGKKYYICHSNNCESIFGIGFGSFSYIYGVGKYNSIDNHNNIYGNLYNFEITNIKNEEDIFVLRGSQEGIIDYKSFNKNFKKNFLEKYKEEIDYLEKNSFIEIKDKIYFLTDKIKEKYIIGFMFLDINQIIYHFSKARNG